jgi:8-oxo-dGTP pyrophosphatase MutT (NUDIX family)
MPMSDYKRRLREKVGSTLLLTPGALALIFDDRRRLLLQQRPNGRWCLPGGEIDPGESPADALVREVWEEMGVTVEPVRVAGVFGGPAWHVTYDNGDEDTALDLVFESRITSGTITPDGIEVVDTAFFGAEEIAGLDLSRSDRLILAQAFHSGEAAYFAPPTWTPPADGIRHNGISPYLRGLREQLGNAQIMVAGAGAAVVDERGDVLLQRRGDNDRWGLVGGGIDPDESPANAVVR